MSSSSYLRKHRRSPSITTLSDAAPPTPTDVPEPSTQASDFASHGSVRQSPPPVNNCLMPTGAVTTPPDSAESSDNDEQMQLRGRELERDNAKAELQELQKAVRAINLKREGSPDKVGTELAQETASEPVSQTTSPTALTAAARKISHSRSSTETKIMIPKSATFDSSNGTSEDDDEDDEDVAKPSLVRKKSGELVKPALRPTSRRRYSSMPGTPTYSKSVHFNEQGNQTRHFLQVDKPIAVSAGTSPVDGYDSETEFPFGATDGKPEREIRLCNFPADTFERRMKPIRVERIFLSTDKQNLIGVCAVQNISFHKLVVARFTLDYWKTTSEVVAEYNNDPRNPSTDGCDRFNFNIKLSDQANIDNKTLLLCMRYNVSGQDFWDNNDNTNYQIDFVKTTKPAPKSAPPTAGLGARPLTAIPRSKHSPPTSSRGRQESIDDDFSARFDTNSAYSFGSPDQLLGESPSSIKLKPRTKRGSIFPTDNATQPSHGGLGGRYDFSNSLSAALSSAQDKLGQKSGLMSTAQRASRGSYFGPVDRVDGPTKATERPDALTTERPAMGSDQYRDLVQKFCYVGAASSKAAPPPPPSTLTAADARNASPVS